MTETFLVWRCVWVDGCKDYLTEDAAERHAKWLSRRTPKMTALVYAVRIWPNEESA